MRFRIEVSCMGIGSDIEHGHLDVVVRGIEDDGEGEEVAMELARRLGYQYVDIGEAMPEVEASRMTDEEDSDENRWAEEPTAEVIGGEGEVFTQIPKGSVVIL